MSKELTLAEQFRKKIEETGLLLMPMVDLDSLSIQHGEYQAWKEGLALVEAHEKQAAANDRKEAEQRKRLANQLQEILYLVENGRAFIQIQNVRAELESEAGKA